MTKINTLINAGSFLLIFTGCSMQDPPSNEYGSVIARKKNQKVEIGMAGVWASNDDLAEKALPDFVKSIGSDKLEKQFRKKYFFYGGVSGSSYMKYPPKRLTEEWKIVGPMMRFPNK